MSMAELYRSPLAVSAPRITTGTDGSDRDPRRRTGRAFRNVVSAFRRTGSEVRRPPQLARHRASGGGQAGHYVVGRGTRTTNSNAVAMSASAPPIPNAAAAPNALQIAPKTMLAAS